MYCVNPLSHTCSVQQHSVPCFRDNKIEAHKGHSTVSDGSKNLTRPVHPLSLSVGIEALCKLIKWTK